MTADQIGFFVGEALVMGVIGLSIGRYKGRPALGFWLGFLIGLIGVIIVACIPRTQAAKMAAWQRQNALHNAGYPYPPQQPYQPGQGPYQPYPPGQGPYQQYPPGQGPYPQYPQQSAPGQWQQPPPPGSWEQQPPSAWPGQQQ
jgi:hypothetical protein